MSPRWQSDPNQQQGDYGRYRFVHCHLREEAVWAVTRHLFLIRGRLHSLIAIGVDEVAIVGAFEFLDLQIRAIFEDRSSGDGVFQRLRIFDGYLILQRIEAHTMKALDD